MTNSTSRTSNTANISLTFNGGQNGLTAVYIYECYDNMYNIGNSTMSSDEFFYYVVIVDLFIMLAFLFFFCSEVKAEES